MKTFRVIIILLYITKSKASYHVQSSSVISKTEILNVLRFQLGLGVALTVNSLSFSSSAKDSMNDSKDEKRYLVTGSTDGIGKHTAEMLIKDGATVLLHGRNLKKLHSTQENLLHKYPNAKLKIYCRDISTIDDTKALAHDIMNDNPRLDALINNAGIFTSKYEITKDGLESTFAVNVMAPYILNILLLPILKMTPKSRVINVSSTSQEEGNPQIILNNLQFQNGGFSDHAAYSLSKLCIAAVSHEFAQRISSQDTLIFSCDPGDVDTQMLRAGWPGYPGKRLKDANDEYILATMPYSTSYHGKYFVNCKESRCNPQVYNTSLRLALWDELEKISNVKL